MSWVVCRHPKEHLGTDIVGIKVESGRDCLNCTMQFCKEKHVALLAAAGLSPKEFDDRQKAIAKARICPLRIKTQGRCNATRVYCSSASVCPLVNGTRSMNSRAIKLKEVKMYFITRKDGTVSEVSDIKALSMKQLVEVEIVRKIDYALEIVPQLIPRNGKSTPGIVVPASIKKMNLKLLNAEFHASEIDDIIEGGFLYIVAQELVPSFGVRKVKVGELHHPPKKRSKRK